MLIKNIKYPNVPLDHKGDSALEYDWFVIDGFGFSIHYIKSEVDLICVWIDVLETLHLLAHGMKKDLLHVLEVVITLYGGYLDEI